MMVVLTLGYAGTVTAADPSIVSSKDHAVLDALLRIPPRHLTDLGRRLGSGVESLPAHEGLSW